MKLTERQASTYKHILLFGPPKSGKTELAGKVAEAFNVVYIDLENGVDTLLKMPHAWKERVDVIHVPDTRSYPMAIETSLKIIKGGKGTVCDAHGKWNCIQCQKAGLPATEICLNEPKPETVYIFDSLTQLTNSAIANITKNQPDDYKLEYDDWGNLGKLMDTFLSHVQQAPAHIICISHETEVEMEDGKNKLVPTAGTRNFSRNTAKYFDEVVYVEVKNKKHVAASSTTYANNVLTGSRSGATLESSPGDASLIPILQGKVATPSPATKNTPAAKAVEGLEAIRARLAADTAAKAGATK